MALDTNWRESRREEERLKGKKETGATINSAMTISVAEEANALSAGDNRACSDGRSGED